MGEYVEPFDKEFLKRTKSIIRHSDLLKYNFTLILNCTLSLICLPIERSNEDYVHDEGTYNNLFAKLCQKMRDLDVEIIETIPNTPNKQMLKCLRNGIAHIKMEAVNGGGQITGTSITGSTKYRNDVYNCTFTFSKKQLKQFAYYMVDEYLKT